MRLKSMCQECGEDGITGVMPTRIPFFRDVILMAFKCEECGFRSSEVQSAEVQEKGCRYELTIRTRDVRNGQSTERSWLIQFATALRIIIRLVWAQAAALGFLASAFYSKHRRI